MGTMFSDWRKHATNAGVLISQAEALGSRHLHPGGSSRSCMGVSLEWLSLFTDVLEEENLTELSTAEAVAKLISIATTLRPPAHLTAPDDLKTASIAAKDHASGEHESVGPARPATSYPAATSTLPSANSSPGTGRQELHVRLLDIIPKSHTGRPHYYLIHSWQGNLSACLKAVIQRLKHLLGFPGACITSTGGSTSSSASATPAQQSKLMRSTYIWIDWVALPQQPWQMPANAISPCSSIGNGSQMWGPPPGHLDMANVRETLMSCSKGALLVLDGDMSVLSRAWTLYEAWAATYYVAPGVGEGAQHLQVVLATDIPPESLHTFHHACARIELARAECTRPEDKQKIVGEVKSSTGIKRMQVSLGKTFLTGLRGYLRWSGDLEDLAMFCVLLMQAGDWAQLQYLLHSLPGLVDDEDTLNEIRDIFAMYDSDGTGELEEEEFAAVLAAAGFAAEEATRIFHEVDADGGGSVGLDEFETWWIESQRQQAREMRPVVVLTQGALVQNLQLLVRLLERRELPDATALIQQQITSIQNSGIQGVKSENATLPPYTPKGDYLHVADQVVFKIMAKELKPALRMVLDLLNINLDALALDATPSAVLPTPSSVASMSLPVARAALAWTMALVAELLGRNPGRLREAMHFVNEAVELANQGNTEKEVGGPLSHVIHARKNSKRPQKSQTKVQEAKTRDSIVTSMVRLKYGSNSLISHRLIAEASISLSTWMASNKQSAGSSKPKGRDSNSGTRLTAGKKKGPSAAAAAVSADNVNDFAAAYLSAGNKVTRDLSGVSADNGRLPVSLPDLCRQLETSYQVTLEHYANAEDASETVAEELDLCLSTWPGAGPNPGPEPDLLATVASPTKLHAAQHSHGAASLIPDPTASFCTPPREKRTSTGQGGSRAGAVGLSSASADDAGIEHLTDFARAVRGWDPHDRAATASPLDWLGSRLEKVRDKQRTQNGFLAGRSPSPYGMGYYMNGVMSGANSPGPHASDAHLPPVHAARSTHTSGSGAYPDHQRSITPALTTRLSGPSRQGLLSRAPSQQEFHRMGSNASAYRYKRSTSPRRSNGGGHALLPVTPKPGLCAASDPLAERLASLHLPVLSPKSHN